MNSSEFSVSYKKKKKAEDKEEEEGGWVEGEDNFDPNRSGGIFYTSGEDAYKSHYSCQNGCFSFRGFAVQLFITPLFLHIKHTDKE